MRKFLITKFVCAKCGTNLSLTYGVPKKGSNYADGEPTGADMVESIIAIEPCTTCARPTEKLIDALKTLNEAIGIAA